MVLGNMGWDTMSPDIAPVYVPHALDGKYKQGHLLLFPEARRMLIFVAAVVCTGECVAVLLSRMDGETGSCARGATPYKKWLDRLSS